MSDAELTRILDEGIARVQRLEGEIQGVSYAKHIARMLFETVRLEAEEAKRELENAKAALRAQAVTVLEEYAKVTARVRNNGPIYMLGQPPPELVELMRKALSTDDFTEVGQWFRRHGVIK